MTKVPISQSRASLTESVDGLHITFPPRRQVFAMIFLPIWLCGWLFGEVTVGRQVIAPTAAPPKLFLIVWLTGWTLGGGFALLTLLWMLFGKERVILRPDALVIRHELLGMARERDYDIGSIANLRISPENHSLWDGRSAWKQWFGGGVIAFDYGPRTFRFGASIDEAEARGVVAQIRMHHSFPDSPPV